MSIEFKGLGIDGHPAEKQLLLALEWELSPDQAAEIKQHLGTCWSCSARTHELQRGVLAFVEYRERRYLPALGAPPHQFRDFPGLLQRAARENKGPGLLTKIRGRFQAFLRRPHRWGWLCATAATTAFVILWTEVIFNPATVSAHELLTRAAAAQNPEVFKQKGSIRRLVHQRVRISSGTQAVTRDFDWVGGSPQARWGIEPDPGSWNAPLTADGFAEWRKSLSTRKDEVKRSGDRWTLDTTAAEKPASASPIRGVQIKEAWIVVRAKDFHPIGQHIRFTDDRQLDFEELLFETAVQKPAVESVHLAHMMPGSSPPRSNPTVPALPINLDETELQLRYTIFIHQWDLGEDLTIARIPGGIEVSGTASSVEVEESMHAVLGMLPNVQVKVSVPGALTRTAESRPASVRPESRSPTPLLRDILDQAFDSPAQRREFVDQCIAASDAELSHAWALKRLVDRYSVTEQRALTPESQARLIEMLRSHLQKLGDANFQLVPLIQLLPDSRAQNSDAPKDWRAAVLALFADVQKQDSLVARLIAGAQSNGTSVRTASEGLRSSHETITALLDELSSLNIDR
jgi:hypothetical protein